MSNESSLEYKVTGNRLIFILRFIYRRFLVTLNRPITEYSFITIFVYLYDINIITAASEKRLKWQAKLRNDIRDQVKVITF